MKVIFFAIRNRATWAVKFYILNKFGEDFLNNMFVLYLDAEVNFKIITDYETHGLPYGKK